MNYAHFPSVTQPLGRKQGVIIDDLKHILGRTKKNNGRFFKGQGLCLTPQDSSKEKQYKTNPKNAQPDNSGLRR
jgi:hypothetical protein